MHMYCVLHVDIRLLCNYWFNYTVCKIIFFKMKNCFLKIFLGWSNQLGRTSSFPSSKTRWPLFRMGPSSNRRSSTTDEVGYLRVFFSVSVVHGTHSLDPRCNVVVVHFLYQSKRWAMFLRSHFFWRYVAFYSLTL